MAEEKDALRCVRLMKIFCHLVRSKGRKFTVQDIMAFLDQTELDPTENVTLRTVQRDMKLFTEINDTPVRYDSSSGKNQYFVPPEMQKKYGLPLKKNNMLAFFLLKRLQTFFAPKAETLEEISEVLLDKSTAVDYDQVFDDFDEKLEESTFLLGEKSTRTLDNGQFDNILTSLVKRQKLKILYHSGKREEPYEKIICPAKLVLYNGDIYFVCMSEYNEKDFFIKIGRIEKADLLDESFTPDPLRIKRIEERLVKSFGMFDAVDQKIYKVKIRFPSTPYYKLIFSEKKFHSSQQVTETKKDGILITLNAPIGLDLINWVLSWPEAVVEEPKELIEEMKVVARTLTKKYGK